MRAEAGHSAARQALDVARQPLAEAERNFARLETEAQDARPRPPARQQKLWPPVIDLVTVAKGYEAALGAALGDDLDAPLEPAAPMHWAARRSIATDPALPEGVAPLRRY